MKTQQIELVKHAVNTFGFLIFRNEKIEMSEFLGRIKQTYDIKENPQNQKTKKDKINN